MSMHISFKSSYIIKSLIRLKKEKRNHKVLHVWIFALLFRTCMVKHVPIVPKISWHSAFLSDPFAHKACHIRYTKQPVHPPED